MKNTLFIILIFVYLPLLTVGQTSSNSNSSSWGFDFGSGFYMSFLRKDDYKGADVSVGGYHFSASYQNNAWILSPVIRYMPYHTLIGEEGTSHNEIGLRGGYLKEVEKNQYSALLGVSLIFGEAYGSKKNPTPIGLYDNWIYMNEDYRAVGFTSEFAWRRTFGNHFRAGISVPVSVSSWYVIAAPHLSVGYRW